MGLITETIRALLFMGLPVAALSFGLAWWALRHGILEARDDFDTLAREIEDFGRRKKEDRGKLNPVHEKWFRFGGGFYGVVALYTYALVEWGEVLDPRCRRPWRAWSASCPWSGRTIRPWLREGPARGEGIMSLARRSAAEFIGTFWLVLGGCGAAVLAGSGIGTLGISFAFGLTVLTMAFAIGHISGCNLNPAVTVGLTVAGRFKGADVPAYVFAQVLGAIAAAVVIGVIAVRAKPVAFHAFEDYFFFARGWALS